MPVTVAVRRRVAREQAIHAQAWVQTGTNLASRFEGFLGSGWAREQADGEEWQMLYRFATKADLDAWERSIERDAWLASGASFAQEIGREHRTGIEGWFDEQHRMAAAPTTGTPGATVDDEPVVEPAPPAWKQACVIYLGFLPLTIIMNLLFGLIPGWLDLHIVLRLTILTTILTPIMTFFVLPALTRLLHRWLRPGD